MSHEIRVTNLVKLNSQLNLEDFLTCIIIIMVIIMIILNSLVCNLICIKLALKIWQAIESHHYF